MPICEIIILSILGLITALLLVCLGEVVNMMFYKDTRTGKRWFIGDRRN
jgi:hypothetical protein